MAVISKKLSDELHEDSIIPKALTKNSKIKIKHYSSFEPITNIVREVRGNYITMDLPLKLLENNILVDDVVVCIFFNEEQEYVLSGIVDEITISHPQKLIVKIESVERYPNMRKHTRYSVSLSANVRVLNSEKTYFAVVKNISRIGIGFTCNVEFEVGTDLVIEIALFKDIILTFNGKIVRSRKLERFYEYGVIQTSIDERNSAELEKYIAHLQKEEEEMFASMVNKQE